MGRVHSIVLIGSPRESIFIEGIFNATALIPARWLLGRRSIASLECADNWSGTTADTSVVHSTSKVGARTQ